MAGTYIHSVLFNTYHSIGKWMFSTGIHIIIINHELIILFCQIKAIIHLQYRGEQFTYSLTQRSLDYFHIIFQYMKEVILCQQEMFIPINLFLRISYKSTKSDILSDTIRIEQQIQMLRFVILALALTLIASQDPCEPFGLRIYYGDVVTDLNSPQKLVIYFNTKLSCPDSYVSVISVLGYKNIPCITKKITPSSFMGNYIAYIHVCSTSDVPFEQSISYTAYGWSADTEINASPYREQWIDIKLIDPRTKDRSLKMIVLADWGTIETNIMTPITNDLKRYLRNNQVNAIMVAGDIAYDLDSQNGRVYEDFLGLLEEVSPRVPFFFTPGNHQRRTVDAALLFNETFKVYGVDKTLASGIYFGSVFLTMFDPYNVIYGKVQDISSLDALKDQLRKGVQSGRFIIPYSHYPLQCSAQFSQCSDGFRVLKPYFDSMLDNGVSLYIGAHSHAYERTYPYCKNGSFGSQQSPYVSGQYLISILEGVAGNNRSIVTSMPVVQPFTAKYTVNQTGFAVIQSNPRYVTYAHFSTVQGFMDKLTINLPLTTSDQEKPQEGKIEGPKLRFEAQ